MIDTNVPKGHYIASYRAVNGDQSAEQNTCMYISGLYHAVTVDGQPAIQVAYSKSLTMKLAASLVKSLTEQGFEFTAFETKSWDEELARVEAQS